MKCCRCDSEIEKIPYLVVGDFSACPECMHEFEILVEMSLTNPSILREVLHKWKLDIKARRNITDIRHLNITVGEYSYLEAEYYRAVGRNDNILKYRKIYVSVKQVGYYLQTIREKMTAKEYEVAIVSEI